tara:strand:- start:43727 stop:44725 length:999 start_codon:yes stop_codon:yes gene_type:complete
MVVPVTVITFLSSLLAGFAVAEQQTPVQSVSMHDEACDVQSAWEAEHMMALDSSARIASNTSESILQMQELMASHKWDGSAPMGEQMTSEEANKWGNLESKLASGTFASLIEGKRERDIRVLERMAALARGFFNSPEPLPEPDSDDNFLLGIVVAMRELYPIEGEQFDLIPNMNGLCTFENALRSEASRTAISALSGYGVEEAFADLKALSERYNGTLEPEQMSSADARQLSQRIAPVAERAIKEIEFARDLYRIAELEGVSKVMLEANRLDQYQAPGELGYSGTTWNEWHQSGRISERQQEMSGAINVINERIPADIMKAWDQMQSGSEEN